MIPIGEEIDANRPRQGIRPDLLAIPERISLTLQNQRRRLERLKMLVAEFFRLAGRMKRIAEVNQAGDTYMYM